jgi:hypothetical protein
MRPGTVKPEVLRRIYAVLRGALACKWRTQTVCRETDLYNDDQPRR